MKFKFLPVLRFLAILMFGISPIYALDWGSLGAGGAGTWDNTTINWYNGVTDVAWDGTSASFGGTGGTVSIAGGVSANSLAFSVPEYLIQTSTLTLTGAATVTATDFEARINSIIAGTAGLTKLGSGSLVLGGANTYTGLTTISEGTLQIGNGGAGGVVVGDILNNSALVFNRSNVQTYAGAISGSGSMAKIGSGNLTLTGTNTYTGTTTVNAGVLTFGTASALPAGGANIIVTGGAAVATGFAPIDQVFLARFTSFSDGAIALGASSSNNLDFDAAGLTAATLGATGNYTYSGTLTPSGATYRLGGGGGVLTMANALGGANSLVQSGAGTVVLPVANGYTGGTTVNGGMLALGDDGALGSGALVFALSQSGVSSQGGARTISNPVTFTSASGSLNRIGGNFDFTFTGAAGITTTANSNVIIGATNTGLTKFSGGINFTGPASSGSPGLYFAGTGDILVDSPLVSDPVPTTGGVARNIRSFLVGSTLTLTAANSYGNGNSLLHSLAGSTVRIATSSATWNGIVPNPPPASNPKQLAFAPYSGGKIIYDLNPVADGTAVVANGIYNVGGIFELVGKSTGTSSLSLNASFFVDLIGSTTVTVNPNGGAGTTLIFNTGNPFRTDNRTFGVGSSTLLDVSAPGSAMKTGTATLPVKEGGLLSWNVVLKDTTGNIGYAVPDVVAPNATLIRYTGATPLASNSSNNNVNYATSGSLTLDASLNPSYNTLQINTTGGGTLDLGGNLMTSKSILVTDGGDYVIQNGQLTGNKTIGSFGTAPTVLVLHYGTGLLTYSGTIEGSSGFTKTGPGTVALTGSNVNSGATIISGGALRAQDGVGLSAGSALVLGGGVLEASGNFTRTLTSAAGGVAWGTGSFVTSGGFAGYSTLPDPSTDPLIIRLNNGNTTIGWAASGTVFVQDGAALLLNSTTANTMVDYQNGIGLGGSGSGITRIVDVADNPNLTTDFARISGVISGATNPLLKQGAGLLELTGANTYASSTTIAGGTLSVSSLANGGLTSNLGASPNSASSLVLHGGTLRYTGAGATTDRLFTLTTAGGKLEASGTGALILSNTGAMDFEAFNSVASKGARTLTLGGNSTANNTLAAAIGDHEGETSVVKEDAGTWLLSGTSTYTGDTTVDAGRLLVTSTGSLNVASDVTINPNATFGGAGTVGDVLVEGLSTLLLASDVVDANGLSAVSVTMDENSNMTFTLGSLNGMLTTTDFLNSGGGFTHINLKLNYSGSGLTPGQTLTLVDYTTTNFNTSNVSQFFVTNVGPVTLPGTLFWDTGNSALKFTVEAIPEPSLVVLLGLGMMFLAGRKFRLSLPARR